jgi:predicted HD phosphohydrolase
MSPEEQRAFEALPGFDGAVRVRRYDDLGKDPELQPRAFSMYVPMLKRLVRPSI